MKSIIKIVLRNIRYARKRRFPPLSQESFARSLGLSRSYISHIETGKRNIDLKLLDKIIILLNEAFPGLTAKDLFEHPKIFRKIIAELEEKEFYRHSMRDELFNSPEDGISVMESRMTSPNYFIGEFEGIFSVKNLCRVIYSDKYDISLRTPDNSIERLNEILRIPDFYDIWKRKNKRRKLSQIIKNMIVSTEKYRGEYFSVLSPEQQQNIMYLNRLLLELSYPESPKRFPDS